MGLTLEKPLEACTALKVCVADGPDVAVRLRLLGYDGCEFESDYKFAIGEAVSIHIYRMGWIRARIVSCLSGVVEAEFDKECSV